MEYREKEGPDGGSSGHPEDEDDDEEGQKREEATAVLKMLKFKVDSIHLGI